MTLHTYIRKLPFQIKARQLALGDVIYDAEGHVLYFQPGDMLIELETDRYTMSRALFDELYTEAETVADRSDQDLPQTESPNLRER